ncbi:DMT family transporter [Campylobacter sputorum]|uniref:DMT family transporter n=1 Tax=Campylobacter sputorum TaxID=206 RepID=UPI001E3A0815|nr:DMT family transporter [Campylobacter sputorum]
MLGIAALAFTAPWVKLSNFQPATSTILRCGIGVLAMLPFALMEIKKYGMLNKQGVILSMAAGFFLSIDFTAWNYSTYYVGSGIASILLNIQVIILPALAFFIDKERIPLSYLIIAPTLLFGVILSGGALEPYIFGVDTTVQGPTHIYGYTLAFLGTVCGLISGLCYGIYLYSSRKASRVNTGQIVLPIFISSAAQLIAPILFILMGYESFDLTNGVLNADGFLPHDPETTYGEPINGMNWFWMIVLGVVGQAVAWCFTQYGSVKLNPTLAAGLLILSPVATVAVIAPVMFGESLSWLQIVGVILTLVTVAYQNGLVTALWDKIKGKDATSE